MYSNHAIKCQQYVQRNANNMADVTLMVVSLRGNKIGYQ